MPRLSSHDGKSWITIWREIFMPEMWQIYTQWLIHYLIIVVVVEAITEIIITSRLFLWLRQWAVNLVELSDHSINPEIKLYGWRWFVYNLLTCGYCLSVWVALGCVWFLPGALFDFYSVHNIVVKTFLTHRLANYLHICVELVRRGRVKTYDVTFTQHAE